MITQRLKDGAENLGKRRKDDAEKFCLQLAKRIIFNFRNIYINVNNEKFKNDIYSQYKLN